MSDDIWRDRRDDDDYSEFGSLFDDAEPTQNLPEVEPGPADGDEPAAPLSFGEGETGSLPHWTEPPTGEVPRLGDAAEVQPDHEELDVWSSFSSEAPVWKDDPEPAPDEVEPVAHRSGQHRRVTGQHRSVTGAPTSRSRSARARPRPCTASPVGSRSEPIRRACRVALRRRPAGAVAVRRQRDPASRNSPVRVTCRLRSPSASCSPQRSPGH